MTDHNVSRSNGGSGAPMHPELRAFHPAAFSRIAMHRPPRIVARRGAGRGFALLQEKTREYEIRLPQPTSPLP